MNKIRSIFTWLLAVATAIFYILIQQKNNKIEKQKHEIDKAESKNNELQFINDKEREAKNVAGSVNSATESDLDSMLSKQGALRDERD